MPFTVPYQPQIPAFSRIQAPSTSTFDPSHIHSHSTIPSHPPVRNQVPDFTASPASNRFIFISSFIRMKPASSPPWISPNHQRFILFPCFGNRTEFILLPHPRFSPHPPSRCSSSRIKTIAYHESRPAFNRIRDQLLPDSSRSRITASSRPRFKASSASSLSMIHRIQLLPTSAPRHLFTALIFFRIPCFTHHSG